MLTWMTTTARCGCAHSACCRPCLFGHCCGANAFVVLCDMWVIPCACYPSTITFIISFRPCRCLLPDTPLASTVLHPRSSPARAPCPQDSLIVKHDVLEDGDFGQRQQVVRWVRSFPFSFLSDREYIIARRLYRTPDALYGVTKGLADHPNAAASHAVRCPSFWSMWASRTVACPWGSDRPATETVLLHHEDFKIPEHLARFAVKHGMWGFVQKMAKAMPAFVAARRKRCVVVRWRSAAAGLRCLPHDALLPTAVLSPPLSSQVACLSALRHRQGAVCPLVACCS